MKLMAAPVSRMARARTVLSPFLRVTVAVSRNLDSGWIGDIVAAVKDGTEDGDGAGDGTMDGAELEALSRCSIV